MAIIVEYHVVADMYPIGDTAVKAGMLVKLGTDGAVIPATDIAGVIGIAGDSKLTAEGQTTAYSDQVTIGAYGAGTRWTANRVSDFYDETAASNKITVYNGGGKFWTDQYQSGAGSAAIGTALTPHSDGTFTTGGTNTVAIKCGEAKLYPSGVPGTETTDGSMAIGNAQSNNYWLPVLLRI